MTDFPDYFTDFITFAGSKGLPSPANTPYETPDYIRSKRSSRGTIGSSHEQSSSPPPLPSDSNDPQAKSRDARYGNIDPKRFTPTLHASLVSEILNLRRELDSKNNLVENLETTLAGAKNENETLQDKVIQQSKDVRRAKLQVQQLEKGTYDAVEELAKERDYALSTVEELHSKLDVAQRTARGQDEDAVRTQRIWETEKESWDNERRQLERRIHVTESHLRTVVHGMASQKVSNNVPLAAETPVESHFKDSGIGNDSDTGSMHTRSPTKHKRNASSLSYQDRFVRDSTPARAIDSPDIGSRNIGHSLADEMDIDEEDGFDIEELEQSAGKPTADISGFLQNIAESRQSLTRAPELSEEVVDTPDITKEPLKQEAKYVDNGFQPSPPPSPPDTRGAATAMPIPSIREPSSERSSGHRVEAEPRAAALEVANVSVASPMSPPQTPVDDLSPRKAITAAGSSQSYSTAFTQTEDAHLDQHKRHQSRDSLSPPDYVPHITIHPSSRPSSPSKYVLPPRTKNASTQATPISRSRDIAVQTEEIRVPKRSIKLPPHLLPGYLLPSPTLPEPAQSRLLKRASATGVAKITTKPAPAPSVASSTMYSPMESSPEKSSRTNSQKDGRSMPLRMIPLPRPILSPVLPQSDFIPEGPLNRSSQYGVTKPAQLISHTLDVDRESEVSDIETHADGFDPQELTSLLPGIIKPPHGRFGLSEPPKAVPEDKEISPERRPSTSGSFGAAPAPSVSSSRANSTRTRGGKAPARLTSYKDLRSRSPSFGSTRASSVYSIQSVAPPFPIPNRSSSRPFTNAHSEGSQSPTPYTYADMFEQRNTRSSVGHSSRQSSLRKVQSAAAMRQSRQRGSPSKGRRRRHSPDLTPVQSMAFESPTPTKFPLPDLPSVLPSSLDYTKGSVDLRSDAAVSSAPRDSEETSLVDAIAATMVGEWMWKYIRRKKSFGVQEDFPVAEDGSISIAPGSTRHKRWVWLSPYERTVMWDSRQPITNTALLGKKGRKLPIQSVLDVRDATMLPRNPELKSAFDRSILILTPQRALKFTAISAERHALWMTALSFLAQSGRLPSQIPPLPTQSPRAAEPVIAPLVPRLPDQEFPTTQRSRSPSFGRRAVRDSIRLAKGRRPELPKSASQPLPIAEISISEADQNSTRDDSAEFPAVPRLYISTQRHQRRRSNTSPRLPTSLSSFRNTSSTANSSTSGAAAANFSSLHPGSTNSSFFRTNHSSKSGSRHDSLASPDRPNFFEAVGTVRMEAFVDPNVRDGVLYVPAPPGGAALANAEPRRRGRGDSATSQMSTERRRAGHVFDDPFKSFDFSAGNVISAR